MANIPAFQASDASSILAARTKKDFQNLKVFFVYCHFDDGMMKK
jgi:hypothetical protein